MSSPSAKKHDVGAYYDEIPYENYIHRNTHPARIGAVGKLFGLNPPDCRTARVLEIGCAGGGNLLAQAIMYPKAHFLGIDISKNQIAYANQQKQAFKLDNIEFRQQDLLTFDMEGNKGKFDYIIAHGVYSWVPEAVRKKVLAICGECLSPQGLAIVSYNVLPGWNVVRSLRDMILYHTSSFNNPAEKAQHGRFLIDFVGELVPQSNVAHRAVFDEFRPIIQKSGDAYISHEHLENTNEPFHFHTFMSAAGENGLDYVGDSDLGSMYYAALHPDVVRLLKEFKGTPLDTVSHEQYMDFVANRKFRLTILCKSGQKMNRDLKKESMMDYSLSFPSILKASGSNPKEKISFQCPTGGFVTEDEVSGTLFLELLACEGMPVAATVLVDRVQKKLGLPQPDAVRKVLLDRGWDLLMRNFIEISTDLPPQATEVGERPVAFAISRAQSDRGDMTTALNGMGATVQNKGLDKQVLSYLDGSKTVGEIVDIVAHRDPSENKQKISEAVHASLQKLLRQGFLRAE